MNTQELDMLIMDFISNHCDRKKLRYEFNVPVEYDKISIFGDEKDVASALLRLYTKISEVGLETAQSRFYYSHSGNSDLILFPVSSEEYSVTFQLSSAITQSIIDDFLKDFHWMYNEAHETIVENLDWVSEVYEYCRLRRKGKAELPLLVYDSNNNLIASI